MSPGLYLSLLGSENRSGAKGIFPLVRQQATGGSNSAVSAFMNGATTSAKRTMLTTEAEA